MTKNSIEVKNLQKNYDGFCLDGVSFCLPKGCVLGLIGENGAGKSTTIKAILGALKPDGGTVVINGVVQEKLTKRQRQNIGVVMDDTALPDDITTAQLSKIMRGIFCDWNDDDFLRYTGRFGLPTDKKIKDFSKGMKMKAAIAVALSHKADILVLDEPTNGLDPVARDEILGLLYEFIQDENRSVLISSHITGDLEKLCDYIVFIHGGKVVIDDEKDKILQRYAVVRGDEALLKELLPSAVVKVYRRVYGTDALVLKELLPSGFVSDKTSLEEIMLFFAKGEKL